MSAVLGSIVTNILKVAIYAVIAWCGIMLGKSVKDSKSKK